MPDVDVLHGTKDFKLEAPGGMIESGGAAANAPKSWMQEGETAVLKYRLSNPKMSITVGAANENGASVSDVSRVGNAKQTSRTRRHGSWPWPTR